MARRTWKAPSAHRPADHGGPRGDGGQRHLALRRPGHGADQDQGRQRRGPDPVLAGVASCALCSRQARGFGYVHHLRWDRFPYYRFCSMRCLDGGSALANRNNGMIDKTDMEQQAIKDARRFLAETLAELWLMELFHDRSADDIDRIIEACVDGFRDSMQRQSANVDVPF